MSYSRIVNAVRLEFTADSLVQTNLSGAAFSGDWLWVAGDEACGIARMRRLDPIGSEALRYGEAHDFPLAKLLALPGAANEEADLEGLCVAEGFLWVVGSHGLKRKNAKAGRDAADNAKRLATVTLDGNRRLLACLPIEVDASGQPCLVGQAKDGRRALSLKGDARSNLLIRELARDPHFGAFLDIPGKDNGFDIEGLAVDGSRLLLGLRGPVLRGWSAVLEIELELRGEQLRLKPLDEQGTLVRKHFLPLEGLGIRDLHFSGADLYILAGPTMALDGDIRMFTWLNAQSMLAANRAPVSFPQVRLTSVSLPHGRGINRAEALCELPPELSTLLTVGEPSWLVLYDAPGAQRHDGAQAVFGDILRSS